MTSEQTVVERTEQRGFFSKKTKGLPSSSSYGGDDKEEQKEGRGRTKNIKTSDSEGEEEEGANVGGGGEPLETLSKSPEQMMMRSKFRKNPKKKRPPPPASKSMLKKKLISVWKRDPGGGKNKDSDGEHTDEVDSDDEVPQSKSKPRNNDGDGDDDGQRNKNNRHRTRRPLPHKSNGGGGGGEDKSSEDDDEDDEHNEDRLSQLRSPPTKHTTEGETETEEIENLGKEQVFKKERGRGRHFSEESRDGDRTDATSVSGFAVHESEEQEKTSSKTILADESFHMARHGLTDPNLWNVVSFEQAVPSNDLDWESWANMTYYPSGALSLVDKLLDDLSVRFLEDEGIFVGNPLQLSNRNRRRLEHRILTENAIEWLGQNGKVMSFPDPYRPERIQLHHDDTMSAELINSVAFKLAKLESMQEFPLDTKTSYEIIVDVGTINFKHHPLMSTEHVLASRLETYCDEYNRRKEAKSTERIENKLKALRVALQHCQEARMGFVQKLKSSKETDNVQEAIGQLDDRIQRCRQDMRKTRHERNQSWKDDKSILTNVLDSWKTLKSLRHNQEYTSTTLKLNIMTTHEDFEVDKQVWAAELEQEFEDVREEYEDEYNAKLMTYRSLMKDWSQARRRRKERRKRRKSGDSKKLKDKEEHQDDDDDDDDEMEDEDKENRGAKSRNAKDDDTDNNSDNSDSSAPSLSSKPVPPGKFDSERTKNDILALFQDLKRLPGEPKISLELVNTGSITAKSAMPQNSVKELQRRKIMEKTKIEFKILFNDQDAYTSPAREFDPDFSVFFGLTIPIKVRERPELLKIIIFETVKAGHQTMISQVQLPLPSRKTSIERCYVQKIEFKTDQTVKTNHAGVGSGVPFSTNKEDFEGIYTFGYTAARIGWTADKDGNILCPPGFDKTQEKDDAENFGLNTRELFESGDIQKWSQHIQLDPNDPRNSKWIDSMAKKLQRAQRRRSLGLLDDDEIGDSILLGDDSRPDIGEFDFCSLDDIDSSSRFKLLRLRDQEIAEFKHLRMIPVHDKDISARIFEDYERRLKDEAQRKAGDTGPKVRKRMVDDDADYDLNRLERIREIRIKVLRLFESSLKQITFDDVIVEEQIPDIGTLGLNIMTLFQPRRPLRPTRRERKRVQGSSLADTKLILIVNIVRAFNLPMRKDTDVGLLTTESVTGIPLTKKRTGSSLSSYSTPKPFVEIWFQRNVCRTTTALGSNPTWNQELQLNLVVPDDDYSQDNLSKMDDLVYLLIYDEVAIDLLEDDRRRDTDIHQRLEKRWLGSITIPFSTLFTNGRIEGTFKLNSPTILLGYEAQGMSSNFINPLAATRSSNMGSRTNLKEKLSTSGGSQVNNQKNAFITLFMTLQPAAQRILTFKEESATGEVNEIRSHVKSWKMFLSKKFPDRNIKPFVMNVDGETILCTRYLKAIQPPETLLNPDAELLKNMEDIAHFVSLFPSVRDSTLGIADYSLWFTSDVFVGTPGGGIEDHAVLLACFFMYLQVSCWILQGNAIPDGPTAYVVTTFKGHTEHKIAKYLKNTYLIWNPCTGEYYFSNDNFCPLQKVWAVIGSSNMWANVSDYERPHQMNWDFTKANIWKPLFSKAMDETKISTVQLTDIKFKAADQVQANSLAQRLERHLKDAFMRWRKTSKTKWNRYCTAILRRLLPRLEELKSGKSRTQPRATDDGSTVADSVHSIISETQSNFSEEHLLELRDIMTSYQMTGFPLQQAYVNMESVTESVFATGVHTIDAPNVEFAIAAFARSYPAAVYSIWLYIAAFRRK